MLRRADNPFKCAYVPELDVSLVLGPDGVSYYQSLRGVMRWTIEIVHININTKVSVLSSHLAMLRPGYLEVVLNTMGYLKLRHNSRLASDPSYPDIDHINFWECNWTYYY